MNRRTIPAIGAIAVLSLALAACGGSGTSAAPASAPVASEAAPSAASGACATSADSGTVAVSIKDFAFDPAQITAKVGDVVAFSNGDTAGHTATLDDGSCTTPTIAGGSTAALVFTAAGTYPFHCSIHPSMTGTIEVK